MTQSLSPVQKLSIAPFTSLYIKRDDMIDPYISGNKWRKLKYILQKATAENKTQLVTFGGAYSTHLLATAAAAARSGLRSTGFVRGENIQNEVLFLCQLFGMKLIFTDRSSYKNKLKLFENYFGTDHNAYFIEEGGASKEAVIGCAEIIDELPQAYDHIFCAAGTGTTAAGLLQGLQQHHLDTKLHVIPVLKGGTFLTEEIAKYTTITTHYQIHLNYHYGGYGKTTAPLLSFLKSFTAKTGLLLDPVYMAKTFCALFDLTEKGVIDPQAPILMLHTGGLLGLLGMKDNFSFNNLPKLDR